MGGFVNLLYLVGSQGEERCNSHHDARGEQTDYPRDVVLATAGVVDEQKFPPTPTVHYLGDHHRLCRMKTRCAPHLSEQIGQRCAEGCHTRNSTDYGGFVCGTIIVSDGDNGFLESMSGFDVAIGYGFVTCTAAA